MSMSSEGTNRIIRVLVSDDALAVELADGRKLSVPLGWYPRLAHGTTSERSHWELLGNGIGIHWPELDEDISLDNLLSGQPSGESPGSFQRWLDSRAKD
jgi:hypothetical protein